MEIEKTPGVVFNIQHYSIHDGPGIRTTVFLKGCPLRCLWCQNPESHTTDPEIFFNVEKCTGCQSCVAVCPEGAIAMRDGKSATDRSRCTGCGKCAEICPSEARTLMGYAITAGEVFEDVDKDALFYQSSEGGVTLSGGDPLFQPAFTESILRLCQQGGIHTALETSGFAKWSVFEPLLKHVDLVLYDFKHMNPDQHRLRTGVSNRLILENAKKIVHELKRPLLARLPVVPGYNDSVENMEETAQFIAHGLGKGIRVHLLPFHRLGVGKSEQLEQEKKLDHVQPPETVQLEDLRNIFEKKGLSAVVGG